MGVVRICDLLGGRSIGMVITFPPRTSSPIMRHAAVWMVFARADVIANGVGRGVRDGVERGTEGRKEPNEREKWRVRRFSRLSIEG
jgi:hypothetical protein